MGASWVEGGGTAATTAAGEAGARVGASWAEGGGTAAAAAGQTGGWKKIWARLSVLLLTMYAWELLQLPGIDREPFAAHIGV